MEKVIGYKLIKPEYKNVVKQIANLLLNDNERYHVQYNSPAHNKLKSAGVLDIWFEPVYDEILKAGRWYKFISDVKNAFFCTSIKNGTLYGYGVDDKGNWFDRTKEDGHLCACNDTASIYLEIATQSDVQDVLAKEARKRGFKSNTEYKSIFGGIKYIDVVNEIHFNQYSNALKYIDCDHYEHCIFYAGVWSKIHQSQLPRINGCKGSFDGGNHIEYGCAEIPIKWFEYNEKGDRKIDSMTLSSGVYLDKEKVRQIRLFLHDKQRI